MLLNKIAFKLQLSLRKLANTGSLRAMLTHPSADVRDAGNVLNEVLRGHPDKAEVQQLEGIEQIRARMLSGRYLVPEECMGISAQEVKHFVRHYSKKTRQARLLYRLITHYTPLECLELGTAIGISGSYQSAALRFNGQGHFVTIEGNAGRACVARNVFREQSFSGTEVLTGNFRDLLPGTLENIGKTGYVFIDGHHDGDATIKYYEMIRPYLEPQSIVVFDDINWSKSMNNAWTEISQNAYISIDLFTMGICFFSKERTARYSFRFGL